MKIPTRGSRGMVVPSVKRNEVFCSRSAEKIECICDDMVGKRML